MTISSILEFTYILGLNSNLLMELIALWEEKIKILSNLIDAHDNKNEFDRDMLAIMIARKNQLIECIEDFKKQFPNN